MHQHAPVLLSPLKRQGSCSRWTSNMAVLPPCGSAADVRRRGRCPTTTPGSWPIRLDPWTGRGGPERGYDGFGWEGPAKRQSKCCLQNHVTCIFFCYEHIEFDPSMSPIFSAYLGLRWFLRYKRLERSTDRTVVGSRLTKSYISRQEEHSKFCTVHVWLSCRQQKFTLKQKIITVHSIMKIFKRIKSNSFNRLQCNNRCRHWLLIAVINCLRSIT